MNSEFDECLKYGKIKPFAPTRGMVSKELSIARKDLVYAQASLQTGNYKWATIQAYYAMFHAARALLYSQGYREKSHYCLIVALRALFVDKALLLSVRSFFRNFARFGRPGVNLNHFTLFM